MSRTGIQSAVREWQDAHHALAKAVLDEAQDLVPAWQRVTKARGRLMNIELSTPEKLAYMRKYMRRRAAAKAAALALPQTQEVSDDAADQAQADS